MGLTGKGLYSVWGRGCAGEPFPCCSMDPLLAVEANSTAVMGMVCSSAVGLLDSAQMRELCPFPISFYWRCILRQAAFPRVCLEAAQDMVFFDVIFAISFTDENPNITIVTLDCSSVLSNYSLGF